MADLLLSTSAHLFQKLGLEGDVPWFQLSLLFGASDQAKGYLLSRWLDCFSSFFSMIEIRILDGPVIQQPLLMILGCV